MLCEAAAASEAAGRGEGEGAGVGEGSGRQRLRELRRQRGAELFCAVAAGAISRHGALRAQGREVIKSLTCKSQEIGVMAGGGGSYVRTCVAVK